MAYLMKNNPQLGPGTGLVQHIDWTPNGLGCACESAKGMGLFESGMDFTGWSWAEWGTVALGGYMLMSTLSTTHRAARAVAAIPGNLRRKKSTRARLATMRR